MGADGMRNLPVGGVPDRALRRKIILLFRGKMVHNPRQVSGQPESPLARKWWKSQESGFMNPF
jgi:hypothetical protein